MNGEKYYCYNATRIKRESILGGKFLRILLSNECFQIPRFPKELPLSSTNLYNNKNLKIIKRKR